MTEFAGIIFDMDGTLVDSEVIWEEAEVEMFGERGHEYTDEVRQQVIGMRLDEFFKTLIGIYQLDETVEALSEELVERMLKLIPTRVQAKAGAQELIEYVANLGIPYCIASSSPQSIIDATVESQGWGDLIPLTFSANLVPLGKPAPDIYLHAAQELGVPVTGCLAIEDSPAGAKSAVAAGITCYVVPDFHADPARIQAITPHVYKDLHAILTNLRDHA